MTILKRFAVFAILLAVCAPVVAQSNVTNVSKVLLWQYDLLAANAAGGTPVYCAPSTPINTSDRVTASSSTTLTAVSGTPFAGLAKGSVLRIIDTNGVETKRSITVWTSSSSVVLSGAAVTITSGKIQSDSFNVSCGTTSAFGWFPVTAANKFQIQVDVGQQVNTGGLQFHLQCRANPQGAVVQVYPALTFPTVTPSYTSALASGTTGSFILGTQDVYSECRVGSLIVTADDGTDTGVNAEQISLFLLYRQN